MSRKPNFDRFTLTDKILCGIIGILLLVIISGTIKGISNKKTAKNTDVNVERLAPKGQVQSLNAPKPTDIIDYFEVGRIRIVSGETAMVISPWLAYPKDDTIFMEELARKRSFIKNLFMEYFGSKSQNEILTTGEEQIVNELMSLINTQLSLGQISDVYFTDYIFLQ